MSVEPTWLVAWVLDLDGVIWLADDPIPGAAEAVRLLQEAGEALLFVTNNSSVPVSGQEEKLARHGIDAEGVVVTSALAAARLLSRGERVLVCAGEGVREAVASRGAVAVSDGPVDTVLVGYHTDFDYEAMARASTAVRNGARLVATNSDATYPTPSGPIPGCGAILASIATASGTAPFVAGKPHEPMADLVRELLGPDGVVVGDRPDTDGMFAVELGYRFALVLSGVTRDDDLPVEPAPELVAPDLVGLVRGALAG